MKFEVVWGTGTEQCVNCGMGIRGRHIILKQNRWAKPRCCKNCLKDLLKEITTGQEIEREQKAAIIYEIPHTLKQNSQLY